MKSPLEFTLLEIEAMLHDDPETDVSIPQRALTDLVAYVHYRVAWMRNYQVQKEVEQIKTTETVPRRKVRSTDQELLDAAEIVVNS